MDALLTTQIKKHLAKLAAGRDEDNFFRDTLAVIIQLEADLAEANKQLAAELAEQKANEPDCELCYGKDVGRKSKKLAAKDKEIERLRKALKIVHDRSDELLIAAEQWKRVMQDVLNDESKVEFHDACETNRLRSNDEITWAEFFVKVTKTALKGE